MEKTLGAARPDSERLVRYCCKKMTNRFVLMLAVWLATFTSMAQIVINEIHYSPDVKTELVEFIELYNAGNAPVNLSGWQRTNAVAFTIPNGTTLAADEYLVVAANPAAVAAKFGVSALGPWVGSLNGDGEKIELRNAAGGSEDEVSYQLGFPWPTVGDPPGYSIELVNPAFDNDLGGNWRASVSSNPATVSRTMISTGATWRYFNGVTEASSPTTAWRQGGFDESSWLQGAAPIGYDEVLPMGTGLSNMQSNFTTVFFRNSFVITNTAEISYLTLEAMYDDGFKIWINGQPVLTAGMAAGEVPCTGTATLSRESSAYSLFNLNWPQRWLVTGTNVIAVQVANASRDSSTDFFWDMRLVAKIGPPDFGPTPGLANSVFRTNLPPQIRQVDHSPNEPNSGAAVVITAKVTDPEGVSGVTLKYQIVTPGNYIEQTDAAYSNNWTSLAMNDAGTNGDELAGDSVFTAVIPASVQQHRRLIRYRISATDGTGNSVLVPYPDDPQPNFAYFCYDGVPEWRAAVHPGVTTNIIFSTNVMRRLPAVHLIAKNSAVVNATWTSGYAGDLYLWSGALVYDGKVYDHIHYRARGGVWRYAMVKNMWKFDLNLGHDFQMRDNYGGNYGTKWSKLNLGACIQQGDYGHRGEQGMFESVGFRLFNLTGVEAPKTTFLQFRIIDGSAETTTNQYECDFWGLYLAVEQEGGRFLDEHDLPDGNFYKMENGTGELNNLGLLGPADKSDLNYFLSHQSGATDAWWRTNLDLGRYYSYRTILEGIHHYDLDAGKNYFYYLNPEMWLWSVHSWDLDLTWANNMYGGGNEPFKSQVLSRTVFSLDYKNRVREIRDLLFNTNQAWQLIDEYAGLMRGPTNAPTFADADRSMWDYNPRMTGGYKAGQGLFYQWPYEPTVTKDFNGCIQLMKNYVVVRGTNLDNLAVDPLIPAQPVLSYLGATNYALNRLTFRSSNYSGIAVFAAMKWRMGEVAATNAPAYDSTEARPYEITAVWESAELAAYNSDLTLPVDALKAGHTYRVRVRMKDSTGRWSRWSDPVAFIAGQLEGAAALVSYLRVSEVMYNPPAGSDFEYIELWNSSDSLTLQLAGANFTDGVNYTFPNGTNLPPGGYLLVIKNASPAAFRAHYGLAATVPVAGPYSGSLANDGEQLTLKTSAGGTEIISFAYGDGRGWPLAADGAGHSLVPLNPAATGQATGALDYPGNWRASATIGGSPGAADPAVPAATIRLNEITAHTDYTDPNCPEYDSNDWIELFNTTGFAFGVTNWFLSDDPTNLTKWAVPNLILPARGWVSFDEVTGFHTPITSGFGLNKAGEQVLLSYLPGNTNDRVVDAIAFKGQENEISLGRYADGAMFWYAMPRTRNTANAPGLAGVAITEIMYHPPNLGTNDNTADEFVELFNPTISSIALQDFNGTWRLDGGISFLFPTNTVIPASGCLLVANISPTNVSALAAFRAAHGITNLSLPILGPYAGKLGNRSDRVALEKPQIPDAPGDPYSWVIVDEVIYGNQSPWPATANGDGPSLQRLSLLQTGLDPANWIAATATSGTVNLDGDSDGMPSDWEILHGLQPNDPSDAALDTDGDGFTNLQEYWAGTDPRNAASLLKFDSVTQTGNTLNLQFTSVAGRAYVVEYRDALASGPWQTLTNLPAAASTQAVTIQPPLAAGVDARFYRLAIPSNP